MANRERGELQRALEEIEEYRARLEKDARGLEEKKPDVARLQEQLQEVQAEISPEDEELNRQALELARKLQEYLDALNKPTEQSEVEKKQVELSNRIDGAALSFKIDLMSRQLLSPHPLNRDVVFEQFNAALLPAVTEMAAYVTANRRDNPELNEWFKEEGLRIRTLLEDIFQELSIKEVTPVESSSEFDPDAYEADTASHPSEAQRLDSYLELLRAGLASPTFNPNAPIDAIAGWDLSFIPQVERRDNPTVLELLDRLLSEVTEVVIEPMRGRGGVETKKARILTNRYVKKAEQLRQQLYGKDYQAFEQTLLTTPPAEIRQLNDLLNQALPAPGANPTPEISQLRKLMEDLNAFAKNTPKVRPEFRDQFLRYLKTNLIDRAEARMDQLLEQQYQFFWDRLVADPAFTNLLDLLNNPPALATDTPVDEVNRVNVAYRDDVLATTQIAKGTLREYPEAKFRERFENDLENNYWQLVENRLREVGTKVDAYILDPLEAQLSVIETYNKGLIENQALSLIDMREALAKLKTDFSERQAGLRELQVKGANTTVKTRAKDLLTGATDAIRKLDTLIEYAEDNPKFLDWDDLVAETKRVAPDPYNWDRWRQVTETNIRPKRIRDEFINRTQTRVDDEFEDAERAVKKIEFIIELSKNIMEMGAQVPQTKRSALYGQLAKTLLTRSEVLRGLTMNPIFGEQMQLMLRTMLRATGRKGTEIGAEPEIIYEELTRSQKDGAAVLDQFLARKFPKAPPNVRALARSTYMMFDYLSIALSHIQRKTQTPGHGDPDDINRLLILDVVKHMIHTVFRYEGHEDSPLLEHSVLWDEIPADWGANKEKRDRARDIQELFKLRAKIFLADDKLETVPPLPVGRSFFTNFNQGLNILPGESLIVGERIIGQDRIEIGKVVHSLFDLSGNPTREVVLRKSDAEYTDEFLGVQMKKTDVFDSTGSYKLGSMTGKRVFDEHNNQLPGAIVTTNEGTFMADPATGEKIGAVVNGEVWDFTIQDGLIMKGEKKLGTIRNLVLDDANKEIGTVVDQVYSSGNEYLGTREEKILIKQTILIDDDVKRRLPAEVWEIFEDPHIKIKRGKVFRVTPTDHHGHEKKRFWEIKRKKHEHNDDHDKHKDYKLLKFEHVGTLRGRGVNPDLKRPVDFEGRSIGSLKLGDVLDPNGIKVGTYDDRLVYDLEGQNIGFLAQEIEDKSGNIIGIALPEVYSAKEDAAGNAIKLHNPGKLRALGAEKSVKLSLSGSLATWEFYEVAEKGVNFLMKLTVEALPAHINEHTILGSVQEGKSGGLLWKLMKESFGIMKMFPGDHMDFGFVPYFQYYLLRLFNSAEEQKEQPHKLVELWHEVVESLKKMKKGTGLSDYEEDIDEIIAWMHRPDDGTRYGEVADCLRPWNKDRVKRENLVKFLNKYFQFKGWLTEAQLPNLDLLSEQAYRNHTDESLRQHYRYYFDIIWRIKPIPALTTREFSQFEGNAKE